MDGASLQALGRDARHVEVGRIALTAPLRCTAVVAVLTAVALGVGRPQAGAALCLGALFVGLADMGESYPRRARTMTWTTLWCAAMTTLGAAVAGLPWLHVATAVVVAGVCGYMGVLGPRAAFIALLALVLYIVFAGAATDEVHALVAGGLVAAGGLVQTAVALLAWPTRRAGGSRAAVATGFRMLAVSATDARGAGVSPLVAASFASAAETVDADTIDEATRDRLRALLHHGEQARLAMLALGFVAADGVDGEDRALVRAAARTARQVARALVWPTRRRGLADCTAALASAAGAVRHDPSRRQAAERLVAALTDAAAAARAPWPIGLRSSDRAVAATPSVPADGSGPVTQRTTAPTTLRRELRTGQVFVGHALRLAAAVGAATLVTVSFDVPHAYWLPMTVAWMAKPDLAGTVSRVSLRVVGTLAGVVLTAAAFAVADPGTLGITVLVSLGSLVAFGFIWANYAIAVTGITVIVLSLFAGAGEPVEQDVLLRLGATVAAGALTLAVAFVRPRRAGRPLVEALAVTATALGDYVAAVVARADRSTTGSTDAAADRQVQEARAAVLAARTSAEAAIVAAEHEPGRRTLGPGQARRLLDDLIQATAVVVAADLATTETAEGRAPLEVGPAAVISCADLAARLRRLDAGEDFRPRTEVSAATAVDGHLCTAHRLLDALGGTEHPPFAVRPPS